MGHYELEKQIQQNLMVVRPLITQTDIDEVRQWEKLTNEYLSTLNYDVLNRLNMNLKKYDAMYIQAVGKQSINKRMMQSLGKDADTTIVDNHAEYNRIIVNALESITQRLALALL